MDLVALLSLPAAVAFITGGISLLTLHLANRHARAMAGRQSAEAAARLQFEASERRYEDRRDAVISLDSVAERETDAANDFEVSNGQRPGERYDDYSFKDLAAAHARVTMLSTPPVLEAAESLKAAVVDVFFGKDNDDWKRYHEALTAFRRASREMLNESPAPEPRSAGAGDVS